MGAPQQLFHNEGRGRFLSELEEEMAFHRAQAEKEFVAGGMTPQDAGYAAMRQFGNAAKLREQSHEAVAFRVETGGAATASAASYFGLRSLALAANAIACWAASRASDGLFSASKGSALID